MTNIQFFNKNMTEIFIISLVGLIFITPNLILNNNLDSSNWDFIFFISYSMRWPVTILGIIYLVFIEIKYQNIEEELQENLTKDSLELMKNFQKHSFNLFKEQVDEWSGEFIDKVKENDIEFTFEDIELGINKNKVKKPYHELYKPPARTAEWVWTFLLMSYLSIQKKEYLPSEVGSFKKINTFFKMLSTREEFEKLQDGHLNIKKDKLVFHGTEQVDITYTNISKIELRRDGVEIKTLKGDNESIYFKTKNFYIIFFTLVFTKGKDEIIEFDRKTELIDTVNRLADDFYNRFRLELEVSKKLLSGDNEIVNNFLKENKLGSWENYRKGGNLDFSKVFASLSVNITKK
jgi:hypothetical protein